MFLKDGKKTIVPKEFADNFKKPVVFELHDSQSHYNVASKKKQFPTMRAILPFFNVLEDVKGVGSGSKGGKELVEWRYATTQRHVRPGDKDSGFEYNPPFLPFNNKGQLVCDPATQDHLEMYYLLANHPWNASIPGCKTPVFFLVDPVKSAKENNEKRKIRKEAEDLVLDETDTEVLSEIAMFYGDTDTSDKTDDQLKDFIMRFVDKDPKKFLDEVKGKKFKSLSEITKAITLGILYYRDGAWHWSDADEQKQGSVICKVSPGEDEREVLARHLRKNYTTDGDYFKDKLEESVATSN